MRFPTRLARGAKRSLVALLPALFPALALAAPTAKDDIVVFDSGVAGALTIEVRANDADGAAGTAHLCELDGGQVVPILTAAGALDRQGSPAQFDGGRLRLTVNTAFGGVDSVTYRTDDPSGTFLDGCVEGPSNTGTIFFLGNRAPQLDTTEITVNLDDGATTIDLEDLWSDPDEGLAIPDSLSYVLNSVTDASVFTATLTGSQLTITPVSGGVAFASLTATDNRNSIADFGATTNSSLTDALRVTVNESPTSSGIPDQNGVEDFGTANLNLQTFFSDDSDAAADLTYALVTNSNTAMVGITVSAAGALEATSVANQFGIADITVSATDSNGAVGTDTFRLTLTNQDDAPTAGDDAETIDEDNSLTGYDPRTNDTEVDSNGSPRTPAAGGTISIVGASVDVGSVSVTGGGTTLDYTPPAHFFGTANVTYRIVDGLGSSEDTGALTITVSQVDDAPTATDDSTTIAEEGSLTAFDPRANDTEVDTNGSALNVAGGGTIVITNAVVDEGTVNVTGSGKTVDYTPDADFFGTATITYTIVDGVGTNSDTGTITVTVTAQDDAPTAVNDTASTDEDTPLTGFDPRTNDSEVDTDGTARTPATGGTITIVGASVDVGNVTVTGTGTTLDYTPPSQFFGTATVTYRIVDGFGGTEDTATVTITVDPVDDAPTAADDSTSINEDTPLTGFDPRGNDSEVDTDGTVRTPGGGGGTITITSASADTGTASVTGSGTTIDYTPAADFFGTATITYTIVDGFGTNSDTGSITVNVAPQDDAPTAVDDTATTDEETLVSIDPRGNDTEVDTNGTALTPGTGGTIRITAASVAPAEGALTFTNTSIDFTPATDFFGTATIDYTIVDGSGGLSDSGQIAVTVNNVDDPPDAVDDSITTLEEFPQVINVLANDSQVDGAALSIVSVTDGGFGTVVNNGDGTVTYRSDRDRFGIDTFTYTIRDAFGTSTDTATVTVDVENNDDVPTAIDDTATTDEETLVTIDPRLNDFEVDTNGTALTPGAGGTITITAASVPPAQGSLTFTGTSIDFTPALNFIGTATIDYSIVDGFRLGAGNGQIAVTVNNVDDAPTAVDDTASTAEDTLVTIDPRANDTEVDTNGSPLTPGTGGTITITAASVAPAEGSLTFTGTSIDFTPAANFSGTATIAYTIVDGFGATSDDGQIVVTVSNEDDAPTAVDDTATTDEETLVSIDPRTNDTEVDTNGSPLTPGAGGTITITAASVPVAQGTVTFTASSVDFTPATNFIGIATITYTIIDGFGFASDDGQIAVTVNNVDDAPTAVDDTATTDEETLVSIDPRGNDTEVDTDGTALTPGAGGTITITAASVAPAEGSLSFSGTSIDFTPATNFFGTATISYTIVDGFGAGSDDGQILVTVNNVDDAPTAVDDTATTNEETLVSIDPRGNDTEVDSSGSALTPGAGGTITITGATVPVAEGSVSFSGTSIDFTPATNFFGTATITYTIVDGFGTNSDTGQIAVTVTNVDDAPTAVNDATTMQEDSDLLGFDPRGNDTEVDSTGAPITPGAGGVITITGAVVDTGSVSVSGGGSTIDYTPIPDFFGTANIDYTIVDGFGANAGTGRIVVTVTNRDDTPRPADDVATIAEDTSLVGFDPLGNDFEDDSANGVPQSPGALSIVGAVADVGTVTVTGGGLTLDYTPPANFFGTATVTYEVIDAFGPNTATADVVITVTQADDAPTAVDDATTIDEDTGFSAFDPRLNDSEVDSVGTPQSPGTITIQSATVDPAEGVVTVTGAGTTLDFTPAANFFGTATINYVIEDGVGTLTANANVVVTVNQVDDAPTAVNDAATTAEDTPLSGFDPRTNDSELDSTGTAQSPGSIVIQSATVDVGSVTVTGGGTTLDYTPPANFFGTATINYVIEDGVGTLTDNADVVVTVTQVDDAPTAIGDATTIDEDTGFTGFDPRVNDSEVDSVGTAQSPGTITIQSASVAPAEGVVTVTGGGTTLDFTPAANFFGTATINYVIEDGVGTLTANANVVVTVNQVDDAPTAVDDVAAASEDVPLVGFDPRTNDSEVDSTGTPQSPGTITIQSATVDVGSVTVTGGGTTLDYTPPLNFFGTATINYVIEDGVGTLTDNADVVVSVNQVDDAPIAVNDAVTIDEDTGFTAFDPRTNDSETDSTGTPQSPGTITIQSATVAPAEGVVTVTGGGTTLDFTPAANFFGTATINYVIEDGVGTATANADVVVTVNQVDDAPTAANDAATIDEDTTLTGFDPFGNDSEVDSVGTPQSPGTLSIQSATVDVGTVTVTGGGTTLDFTPPANFFGTATINYVIEDGVGTLTANADVVVTVTQVDDAPVAADDAATIDEDTSIVAFDPRTNDSEVDSTGTTNTPGSITIQSATVAPAEGVVTVTGGGTTLDFTPAANFFGTATINYVIEDGVGTLTDDANFVVTVNQVDDAPTAVNDAATINEDTVLTAFDPFGNDSEVDSVGTPQSPGTLSIQSATVDIGTVTVTGGGTTLDYTPPLHFFGTATINYVIEDGVGTLTANADVVVTVTQVDDAPVAADDAATIDEDTFIVAFDPRTNDSEVDSTGSSNSPGSITIQSATVAPAEGVVTVTGGGTTLDFTPAANFFGTATINYVIEDGVGTLTDDANLVVTVNQVDDAPTAVNDAVTINEDTLLTAFDPFGNDSEVDSVGTPQSPGTLSIQSATVDIGTVTVTGGGTTLDYTPPLHFFGTATINYVIEDGVGTLTANADVVVTVTQVDDAPVAADDVATIDEDTPLTAFDPRTNDSEVDSTGTSNSPGSITIQSATVDPTEGVVTVTGGGTTLDFTPAAHFFGTAMINYVIEDGVGTLTDDANLVVTVNQIDDAPTAVDDVATMDEDTVLSAFDPFGNDFEVDSVGTPQTPGTLSIQSATVDVGTVTVTGGGTTLEYTPPLHFFGTATINYVIEDGIGTLTDNADVVVTVNQVDDAPVAVDDAATIDEDTSLTAFDPRTNDSEVDSTGTAQSPGTITIQSATVDPAEGVVTVTGGGTTLDFTPATHFFGTATISYVIEDGVGTLTDTADVLVTVNQVDDAPTAADDAAVMDEDTVLSAFDPFGNDFEVDSVGTPQSPGSLSIQSATVDFGTVTITGGGATLEFTPPLHFFGTATINYVIEDGVGTLTDNADVVVTVNQVDDAPTAVDDAVTIDEEVTLTGFDPRANDSEVDSTGTAQSPGTITIQSASVDPLAGVVTVTGGGTTIEFDPEPNFFGTATIDYRIEDGVGTLTDDGQIVVTVNNIDDAPNSFDPFTTVFGDDVITVTEDTPLTFAALANDVQVDGPAGEPMIITAVGAVFAPTNGTVSTDGTQITYTPDPDYYGTDFFSYTVRDSFGTADFVNFVNVTITPVDDAPRPVDDVAVTDEDTTLAGFDPRLNDLEVDTTGFPQTPGAITIQSASVPGSQGSVTVTGGGTTIDYEPAPNFFGAATITYVVEDGSGFATATAEIVVDVIQVDDAPTAQDDLASTNEDVPIIGFAPLVNDFEVDSTGSPASPGSMQIVSATVDIGAVAITGSGTTLDFTPDANFFGTAIITYEVSDAVGPASSTAIITVSVAEVNDAPVAGADVYIFDEDSDQVVLNVTDNDFLFDAPVTIIGAGVTHVIGADAFTGSTHTTPTTIINATGDPVTLPNGSVSIDGLTILYEPKGNYNGTDFFEYVLQDADGETATGRVDITINSINDPPEIPDQQTFSVVQDTVLTVPAGSGILVPAFDPDADPLTAILQIPPTNGSVIVNPDGSFTYQPNIGFVGIDSFFYFASDGVDVNEGGPKEVAIDVTAAVVVVTPPPSGTVDDLLPLAQIPLELVEGVDPNVLIIMDDSGSMDFSLATTEDRAVMTLRNHDRIPRPSSRRTEAYDYLTHFRNNTYNRGGLPSEAELLGSSLFGTTSNPNQYGVWRGRNHLYNKIYYNPEVRYRPWRGVAADGGLFDDANITNAALNPTRAADGTINLRNLYSYQSRAIPEWDNNGGDENRTNENYYIPRYYRVTTPGFTGEPAWNTPHCLVEIRPAGEGYTDKDENADVPICAAQTNDLGGGRFSSVGAFPGGPDRSDCANPLSCSYTEEIQNFANWFVYYRNREYTVKASLGAVVADVTGLSIGYGVLNRTTERLRIRPMEASFRGTNKAALLDQIYRINSSGGTPLRRSLDRAGRHFRCVAGDTFASTTNTLPGNANCPVAPAPAGLCQQQFTLLFTDGVWNSSFSGIGNEDTDEGSSNFDGGFFADGNSNTLGDIAMFYYETDIHGSLANLVPTTARDRNLAAPDAFENAGNEVMHQHMTTFTVGFGVDGVLTDTDIPTQLGGPPATVSWGNPFSNQQRKIDDLRHAALNGRGDYLSAADPSVLERELRAAFEEFGSGAGAASAVSFNSQQVRNDTRVFRGFYNTDDNTGDLVAQLVDFTNNTVVEPPVWSASDLLDLRTADDRVIITYDREPFEAMPAPKGIPFRAPFLNAQQQAVLTSQEVDYLRGDRSNERPLGTLRERAADNGLLGDIVNSSPVFVGTPTFFGRDRVEFPVGSGDLYSDFLIAQQNRAGMVYVGANDGMLHAFEAENGNERWAYIPDRIIRAGQNDANEIRELTIPTYEHLFYVDNQPAIADVFITPRGLTNRSWRTVLVGSLRAGGKGLFAIDITNPTAVTNETTAAANVMWEFTDEDDSYPIVPTLPSSDVTGTPAGGAVDSQLDDNGRPVRDLGFTYSVPTIGMTNVQGAGGTPTAPERKWAAIFGNGYNSTYGFSTLFVNFIEDGNDGSWDPGDFVKIRTGAGPSPVGEPNAGLPNGLGEPRLIDLDGNGTVDFAYAGDLRGFLYRFDMTDPNPNNWTSTQIFRATYSDGTPQPITTQPIVTRNTQADGVVVLIGTGSYFTTLDGTDTTIQSIYGIWDRIQANPFAAEAIVPTAAGDRTLLVEQDVINLFDESLGALRSVTSNEVIYDIASVRGWYIDLDAPRPLMTVQGNLNPDVAGDPPPGPQFPGERAVRNLDLRGGFLFLNTVIPRDNLSCDVSPGGFGLAINPLTGGVGGASADTAFDINNDGNFDAGDMVGGNIVAGLRFDDAVPTDSTFIGTKRFTQLSDRTLDIRDTNTGFGSRTGRLSWREL